MKNLIFTFLLLSLSSITFAQRNFPSFTAQEFPEELSKELKLDESTEKKIGKLYIRLQEDVMNTIMIARKDGETDRAKIKAETDELRDKHLTKVKGILDTETYASYEKFMLMERGEKQAYLLELKLELTTDQKEKYDAINASSKQVFQQIREQHKGDREAMKEALEPVMKQHEMMLSQVLTEEQMIIYKEAREAMKKKGRRGGRGENGRRPF
ncbi:hypothetical protein [Flammeovirga sp. EKP202]|uniref:hypothetical protein n=1 Tax=Flammeovirga sp. EKP202 TaxID=2770592 RepID=UPI00165EEC77|nr:hypothetical protein [Flammeovirga sp. EKP202]MBD0404776.1 hypothetical protein [Flammeovirga sp. EKP202]